MGNEANGRVRPVRLRDVAARAGVDISTASRALSGQRKVSADATKRVNEAAAALGFAPNQAARNLRLSRTMVLGVVTHHFDSPIYLDALEGLGGVCHDHGYELMITTARGDAALYQLLVQRLYERRVDGLILWTPPAVGAALDPFTSGDTPVLAIGVRNAASSAVPHINVSEAQPIDTAVQRLTALGHRSLFYLSSPRSSSRQRLPGLQAAARRAGVALAHEEAPLDQPMPALCEQLRRQLVEPGGVTAVIADHRHLGRVTAALHLIDVRVPADVSLVGFARSRWAQEIWLPTATIQTDAVAFGRVVGRTMIDWLGGTRPPETTEVPAAEWIERTTIGPAPRP
ncbi:MAG: LacI family DNA-binding transcriptional regulator [Dehalococcoidia bacterium]